MKTLIGIRREDKNSWEKRVPLIPAHAREIMLRHPVEIRLQPSSIRIFSDEDYRREGAQINEDLTPCPIIFAVKEIPVPFFEKEKTYIFFSHTIKGQLQNMPLLKKMIDFQCTLIDYEKIVNKQGQRLVFFGKQAGQAGMIDTFWAFGRRLIHEGIENPFSSIKQAYQYASLVEAKEDIEKVGWEIDKNSFNPSLAPFVCGFAGYGNVSQGAQEMFDLLPHEEISPLEISSFFEKKSYSPSKIYKTVFKEEHMVKLDDSTAKFELQDYYDHPQRYSSIFDSYLPFITILINCIYWSEKYPRFVTKKSLRQIFKKVHTPRLRIIGDISCDVEGSVECTVHTTTPEKPVFVYDPLKDVVRNGFEGRGVVIMAIDNLPAEISLESSIFFSSALKPFVPAIAKANFSGNFSNCNLPEEIRKAIILYKGTYTPDYDYMKEFLNNSRGVMK